MSSVEITDLSLRFGGIKALSGVTLSVADHGVHALVGPNGAGKTSLLNCMTRVYAASEGDISIFGRSIGTLRTTDLARMGVARTFQHAEVVRELSVIENAMLGVSAWGRGHRNGSVVSAARESLQAVGLLPYAHSRPSDLAYGLRKRIELARVLTQRPRLLLLDEPTAGLSEGEIDELKELVLGLSSGLPIILVAHHMEFVMAVAEVMTVLDRGRVISTGDPRVVSADPRVKSAYLGITDDLVKSVVEE